MSDVDDALTRLLQEHVGRGRRLTVRAFEEQAVDPESGYRMNKSSIGEVIRGHQIKMTPPKVRAIAAGLGDSVTFEEVWKAAIRQYIGIVVSDGHAGTPEGDDTVIRIAHEVGATADELAPARDAVNNPGGKPDPQ
ncbi:hypothetical protein ACFU96_42610 [Streptomyces sp. NPDC057620]|uniref:hypothetical protein n=1 Tax=Streptomyces sp. NPDC057620 TaxID=3346185 RepID=UPI0036A9E5B9